MVERLSIKLFSDIKGFCEHNVFYEKIKSFLFSLSKIPVSFGRALNSQSAHCSTFHVYSAVQVTANLKTGHTRVRGTVQPAPICKFYSLKFRLYFKNIKLKI